MLIEDKDDADHDDDDDDWLCGKYLWKTTLVAIKMMISTTNIMMIRTKMMMMITIGYAGSIYGTYWWPSK